MVSIWIRVAKERSGDGGGGGVVIKGKFVVVDTNVWFQNGLNVGQCGRVREGRGFVEDKFVVVDMNVWLNRCYIKIHMERNLISSLYFNTFL